MGRNAKGKVFRKRGATSKEVMKRAVEQHLIYGVSIRQAAKEGMVAYPTLHRYVKKYLLNSSTPMEPNYAVNKIFTSEQEASLQDYIIVCANKFHGITTVDCRRIAYQMARINRITSIPSSWVANGKAGIDWMRSFKYRYPFELKKYVDDNNVEVVAFNREKFFNDLNELKDDTSLADGIILCLKLDDTLATTVVRRVVKTESELSGAPDLTILKTEPLEEPATSTQDYEDPLGLRCFSPSGASDINSDHLGVSSQTRNSSQLEQQLRLMKKQLAQKDTLLEEKEQILKEKDTRIESLAQCNRELNKRNKSLKLIVTKMKRKVLEMNSIIIKSGYTSEESDEDNSTPY